MFRHWSVALIAIAIIIGIAAVQFGLLEEYVVLNPGAPQQKEIRISVSDYDRRLSLFIPQVRSIKAADFTVGLYSRNIYDIAGNYFRYGVDWTESQEQAFKIYAEKFNKAAKSPGLWIAWEKNTLAIDVYGLEESSALDDMSYAFLLSEAGMIPVYPNPFGYKFTMVHVSGSPGYYTRSPVPMGEYTLYLIHMADRQETNLQKANLAIGFRVSLRDYGSPVNETLGEPENGHAWIFTGIPVGPEYNPYKVGRTVYVKQSLVREHTSLKVGEPVTVIEADLRHVRVRFQNGIVKYYHWSWFSEVPEQ